MGDLQAVTSQHENIYFYWKASAAIVANNHCLKGKSGPWANVKLLA